MAADSPIDAMQTEENQLEELRKLAEQRLGKTLVDADQSIERCQHELHVYEIELEMQNDALRQAQATLIESRDRYLDLYDFAPVGYLTTSSEGIIEEANLTFAKWLGVARNKLIGSPCSIYVQGEHKDRWHTLLWNSRQSERQELAEIGFQQGDGVQFFARLDCLSSKDKHGLLKSRIAIVNLGTISAAEKLAIEGERRYRTLYESMRDAFAFVDLSGKLLRFNQPFQDLLGYSNEELQNKNYKDLTPEKWHAMEAQIVEREILCDGESSVYEKEYIRRDGSIVPVELKTVLLKNAEGYAEGMWAVVRDISSRKLTEAALLASESRYRLATKAIAGFVYDWDVTKNKLVVTEGYVELTGQALNPKLTIWDWCRQFIHPNDYLTLQADLSKAKALKPERFHAAFRFRHHDGGWLSVSTRTLIVYDQDGQAIRMVGSFSNISRRVAAEAALRMLNDSLEEQVLERSSELQSRLLQLHESERFIRATLDEVSSALAVVDAEGRVIFRNKNWQELVAQNESNGVQSAIYSPYCDDSPGASECPNYNKLKTALEAMLGGRRRSISLEYESKVTAPLPKSCWIASRISRFKGEGPTRLVLTHEDITERKLAAIAVSQSAKNFKAMLRKMEQMQLDHSKQIAREVHDQLGATLTMLKLGLATTLTQQGVSPQFESKVSGMLELANLALQSVKRVTASLRPSLLDTLGLSAAVNWHAKEFSRMTGIETEVRLPDFVRLSTADSETSFRIIQEALTNVAKHAKASKVMIAASKTKRFLNISICDNGIGLEADNLKRKNSFGVIGMQERAKRLHGAIFFEPQKNGGTCLRLKIPFAPHAGEN